MNKYSEGQIIQSIYSDDPNIILYRKDLRNITKSILSSILLSQIMYWYKKKNGKFYKFKQPCTNSKYKLGDSWCEELNCSREEFDTALKNIGCKRPKSTLPQNTPQMKNALIWYNTDMNRITWYELNTKTLQRKLAKNYDKIENQRKVDFTLYNKCEVHPPFNTETTTEKIISFSKEKANALFAKGAKVSEKTICKRKGFLKKVKKKALKGAIFKHKSVKKKRNKSNGAFQDHCQEHPKGKYIYTTSDISCYQQLKKAGATKHNETKKSYFKTMDAIHALFSTRCKMPYLKDPLAKEFKNHNWTIDEVLKAFNYYITYHKTAKTGVSDFIITTTFKGNKTWSPLLHCYLDMLKTNPKRVLTANGTKLRQAFKRHDKIDITKIDFKILNKIGNEIAEIDQKYKFLRDFHDCPFGFYDYFVRHYLSERLNDNTFKLEYMHGKEFINWFIDSMIKKNTIMKRTR